ncbi:C1q-related factor-like isoform X1 [Carassius auratus]|uniref:C1q-related factor-like isoform X1 n=1 Tax=Carassius auratus TaxID=7957 RepID=A0A6P6N6U7_CARAU|nr:C1q-related factor-like isoform X1 [Carassius auratus]
MFCFILLGKQGAPGYEGWPGPKGIQSKAGASGPFGGKGFPGSPGPSGRKVCTETAGLHSNSATQSISLTCPIKHSPTSKHKNTAEMMLRLRGDSNEEILPSHVIISKHGNSTGEGSGEFRASQRRHSKSHKRCSFGGEGDAGIILGHLCFFTEHMVEMYCYQEILFS